MTVFLDGLPSIPVDWYDSAALLAVPYNPDKVNELAVATATPFALDIDIYIQPTTNTEATLISFAVTAGTAQNTVDAIIAAMNAVCVDPTRNDLTEEQQEEADLDNKIQSMKDVITELAGDDTAVPPVIGMIDNLAAAAFNAANPTDANKISALRSNLRSVAQNLLKTSRAVRYLLKEEEKRTTGTFSLMSKR